ncbi:MAG TPA: MAPEG family protein [Alphaproteobacteria bacterium]|jgi:hypothetical protein
MAESDYASFDFAAARRKSATAMVVGTAAGWLVFFLIFGLFAAPAAASKADRLGFAAQWLLPLGLLLLAMTLIVAILRNFSPAMDPTLNQDPRYVDVSRRVLTNTVEQGLIFALFALAIAAAAPAGQLGVLAALAVMFVASRIAFWLGYLAGPFYRSLGVMGMQINVVMAIWAVVSVLGYQSFWRVH